MTAAPRLVVEADGGSRGNPGTAGYGALVREAESGRVLLERAAPLGVATNNVAEYAGLIAGLEGVLRVATDAHVVVRMDSKLVVEQMSGRWKIKHEDMQRLALQARDLVGRIRAAGGTVRFEWVPREHNKAADALSNDGMDGRTIDREPRGQSGPSGPSEQAREQEPRAAGQPRPVARAARVLLVRHGLTDNAVSGRLDGRGGADLSLNAEGRAQVAAMARLVPHLLGDPPVRVVTSTLARSRETGLAIAGALKVEPVPDDGWDERDFGDWEGLTLTELQARHPAKVARARADAAYRAGNGESRDQVRERVLAALERALGTGGTVVVATSRVPILVVLAEAFGSSPDRFWAPVTPHGCVSAVDFQPDGQVSVAFVNGGALAG